MSGGSGGDVVTENGPEVDALPPAPAPPQRTGPAPEAASRRRDLWLLAGVAVVFFFVELWCVGLRYPLSTDEVIYLSQLNPEQVAYPWDAWRAWGVPVLGAPVAVLDAPLPGVRLYFGLMTALGLFLAFRPWVAASRWPVAPLAAALFGGTAATIHNATLALPNLYCALAAVAATGYFVACRRDAGRYRRNVAGLTVAVALAVLLRPSDGMWLVLPLGLGWLGLRAWRRPAVAGAIVVGQVVGWAPWVVESFRRFDGPFHRLHLSSEMLGGTHLYPDLDMVVLYARLWGAGRMGALSLDVPANLRGGSAPATTVDLTSVGFQATTWWYGVGLAVVLGIVGAALGRRAEAVALLAVPLVTAVSVAFPYLFMLRYGQLRFLLPAVALATVPAAYGLLRSAAFAFRRPAARGPRWRHAVGGGLVVAAVLGLAGTQVATARGNRSGTARADIASTVLVDALRGINDSGPCSVAGYSRFNVAYQLQCTAIRDGAVNWRRDEEPESIRAARARGERVVIVVRGAQPVGAFLALWQQATLEVPGSPEGWTVYLSPE